MSRFNIYGKPFWGDKIPDDTKKISWVELYDETPEISIKHTAKITLLVNSVSDLIKLVKELREEVDYLKDLANKEYKGDI